ncbi:lipid-binding serum glycoprotein family protein [Stylonychia lemnae]|uniref:Lipid-binding serum glycoprotein family protein n=1 Tax=Stylonychia lemnae TaxID=5949 RepID=A0A078ACX0_STYLE|nr:lipid-binding serum glycoprotein family protein [Stylonychia lemnae]|eukprot:CDW80059.1 lipid-binding serum glycoprotein family protein [Stylonychia lemnae]
MINGTQIGSLPRLQADLYLLKIDMNATNITINNLYVSNKTDQVILGDEEVTIDMRDFIFNMTAEYSYITDPPIFADFGLADILINNMSALIRGTTFYENQTIHVDIEEMKGNLESFDINFDGLSDFSIVLTDIVGFFVNLLGGKIAGIAGEELSLNLVPLINKIIQIIPTELPIPGTNLYLLGGFDSNLHVTKDSYMRLPLSASLQSRKEFFDEKSEIILPQHLDDPYEIQLFLSEYTINSISHALHVEDYLKFSTQLIKTDQLSMVVGSQLFNFFDHNMTCQLDFDTVDPYPNIDIKPDNTIVFVNITTDISCRKHENDTQFYHVANMLFLVNTSLIFEIDNNLTIKGQINDLKATITNAYNSTIGEIAIYLVQLEISLVENVMKGIINSYIEKGYSLYWIITDVFKITFLDIREIQSKNGDGFLYLELTPVFNITKAHKQAKAFLSQDEINVKTNHNLLNDPAFMNLEKQFFNEFGSYQKAKVMKEQQQEQAFQEYEGKVNEQFEQL